MKGMSLEKIAEAVGGRLEYGRTSGNQDTAEAADVVIDSRKAGKGSVFVATRGERADGHDYIGQVFEKGALGVICEKLPEGAGAGEELPGPCIVVEDSFAALRKLAKYYRAQMSGVRIVGIVGSVGKTSTKELVASVLEQSYNTLKTEGNLNNEIGVPLTILRLRDEHEAAVVEMGINHFGEMDRLGDIVKPDAVVMTNIGPCHLEFLQDLDGVLRAKSEVFRHIRKGGTLILNAEDEKLNTVSASPDYRIVRYGRGGDVYAEDTRNKGLEGSETDIVCKNGDDEKRFHAAVHLPGSHMVLNSLAATAAGLTFGMEPEKICAGIEAAKPMKGRSNIINTGKYLVIDDCYNANPKADCAAIDLLGTALGRKVAILGDMFELGDDAPELHAGVGKYAATHGVDLLICAGELSANMYEAAKKANTSLTAYYYETLEMLLNDLDKAGLKNGDAVLVKASHGMCFSKVVDTLIL